MIHSQYTRGATIHTMNGGSADITRETIKFKPKEEFYGYVVHIADLWSMDLQLRKNPIKHSDVIEYALLFIAQEKDRLEDFRDYILTNKIKELEVKRAKRHKITTGRGD